MKKINIIPLLLILVTLTSCFKTKKPTPPAHDHFTATINGTPFEAHIIDINYNVDIIIVGIDTINNITVSISADQLTVRNNSEIDFNYSLASGGVTAEVIYGGQTYVADREADGSIAFFENDTYSGPISASFDMMPHRSISLNNIVRLTIENGSFYVSSW